MKKIVWIVPFLLLCACSSGSGRSEGAGSEPRSIVVDDQHARVIMRSDSIRAVEFSVRRESSPGGRPEVLGRASKSLPRVFGWLDAVDSALDRRAPQLELQADAGVKLQVLGYWKQVGQKPASGYEHRGVTEKVYNAERNRWDDKPLDIPMNSTFTSCGVLGTTFVPEKRKVYLVEFSLVGDGCRQQVYDITRADARGPVTLLEDFPPASRKVSED